MTTPAEQRFDPRDVRLRPVLGGNLVIFGVFLVLMALLAGCWWWWSNANPRPAIPVKPPPPFEAELLPGGSTASHPRK